MSNFELQYTELGGIRSRVQGAGANLANCSTRLRRQVSRLNNQSGFGIEQMRASINAASSATSTCSRDAYTIAAFLSDLGGTVVEAENAAASILGSTEPKEKWLTDSGIGWRPAPIPDIPNTIRIGPDINSWSDWRKIIETAIVWVGSVVSPIVNPIADWWNGITKRKPQPEKTVISEFKPTPAKPDPVEVEKISAEEALTQSFEARLGQTISSVGDPNSQFYWGAANMSYAYKQSLAGECTWYAYGRFLEVTGIALYTAQHAKFWLTNNANDPRLSVSGAIQPNSIAVRTTGTYGHVMFIEHVTYDAQGNPLEVYFTESNADRNSLYNAGVDGVLQKMSYAEFVAAKNPSGYISKKP